MQITIANQSQLHGIIDLISSCRHDLISSGIYQWDEQYPNQHCIARDLAENSLFVVKLEDTLVGTIALNQNQEPEYSQISWSTPTPSLVIHRLCVSPFHQCRGIGSALMRFAEVHAINSHCNSIRLDVYSGNPDAVNLYRRFGYNIVGQITFPRRNLPFYCMEKAIDLSVPA